MRILHVCGHFHPCVGGIEKYVYDLCINLNRMGHTNDVACLNTCSYGRERLPDYSKIDGINVYRFPYMNLKFYKIAPSLIKKARDYDLIHVHGMGFPLDYFSATKIIHGKPLVINTHSAVFHTKDMLAAKKFYFFCLARLFMKNVGKVMADGEDDRILFSRISKRVEKIPVAIDARGLGSLKRAPEKNMLVYTGRISKNKRIDNLLRTFYHVRRLVKGSKLYVVGDDWQGLTPALKKLASELGIEGDVVFTGRVDYEILLGYLRRAHLYLFPSEFEGGTVISVLEAMALGLPPVVNSMIKNTCSEWLVEGRNGFYVDFADHENAGKKIAELMGRNVAAVSSEAMKTAMKFDWSVMASEVERIYREAVS